MERYDSPPSQPDTNFESKNYKIKLVTIRGERHSGTGWLRQMLSQNCPNLQWKVRQNKPTNNHRNIPHWVDADGKYGWKHAILDKPVDEKDLVIFVFRNITSWIPRMRLKTYETMPKSNLPMARFLHESWRPNLKLDSHDWKNIFEMRTAKYKSWIEYCEKYPENAVGVMYEDLVENSESFFGHLVNRYDVPCKEKFMKSDCYSKFGACKKEGRKMVVFDKNKKRKVTKVKKEEREFTERSYSWSKRDWKTLIDGMDKNLESKIGYDFL